LRFLPKEGFDKREILVVFNAGVKIKPQLPMSRDRGFYFYDKAEDGQKNSFAKPSKSTYSLPTDNLSRQGEY
jgi:hypothetical protein